MIRGLATVDREQESLSSRQLRCVDSLIRAVPRFSDSAPDPRRRQSLRRQRPQQRHGMKHPYSILEADLLCLDLSRDGEPDLPREIVAGLNASSALELPGARPG